MQPTALMGETKLLRSSKIIKHTFINVFIRKKLPDKMLSNINFDNSR